jgi:hypothetical protein
MRRTSFAVVQTEGGFVSSDRHLGQRPGPEVPRDKGIGAAKSHLQPSRLTDIGDVEMP